MEKENCSNFKLILLPGALEFGQGVNACLKHLLQTDSDFILPMDFPRFNDGEAKAKMKECNSARNARVFILQDYTNCFVTYNLRGIKTPYSPDDHYRDIIRAIGALRGHAKEISVIMPFLYEGRQHKGSSKESLDCALALQELAGYGVKRIITFDVHNDGVTNAIPRTEFKNIHPTNFILRDFIENEEFDPDETITICPDTGAIERGSYIRDIFGNRLGVFNKERDRVAIIDGKAQIKDHTYIGPRVYGKDLIIRDDIIDSGGSMIDTIRRLKAKGARRIYVITTFALFSKGYEEFDQLYEEGILCKVYATNLTYVPEALRNKPWFHCTDCSMQLAEYLVYYKNDRSLNGLDEPSQEIIDKLAFKRKKRTH